jgi:hypothetical protein
MEELSVAIAKGICVAFVLIAMRLDVRDWRWWVGMLSMNVALA